MKRVFLPIFLFVSSFSNVAQSSTNTEVENNCYILYDYHDDNAYTCYLPPKHQLSFEQSSELTATDKVLKESQKILNNLRIDLLTEASYSNFYSELFLQEKSNPGYAYLFFKKEIRAIEQQETYTEQIKNKYKSYVEMERQEYKYIKQEIQEGVHLSVSCYFLYKFETSPLLLAIETEKFSQDQEYIDSWEGIKQFFTEEIKNKLQESWLNDRKKIAKYVPEITKEEYEELYYCVTQCPKEILHVLYTISVISQNNKHIYGCCEILFSEALDLYHLYRDLFLYLP